MRSCALLLVVAGCNQIYGLDSTQLEPEIPVTGRLVHRWTENDAMGGPALREDATNVTNDIYLGVRIGSTYQDLDIGDDGSFRFTRNSEDTPYQLVVTQDGELFELHHDAPSVTYVSRTAGRHDAEPQVENFKVTFPKAPGTSRGAIASTGIWAYVETETLGATYTLEWRNAFALESRHGLVDTNRNDAFYYLDFESTVSPENLSYQRISGAQSMSPLTMGTTDIDIAAVPTRVTATPCSKLVGALGHERKRLRAALPAYTGLPIDGWVIAAVPDFEVGLAGAIQLSSGASYLDELEVTPTVFNPIEHSKLAVVTFTTVSREIKHPLAVFPKPERASITHSAPIDCNAPVTTVVPTTSIGIPIDIRLEDIALDRDDVDIVIPDRDLELTWSVSPGLPIDSYSVVLYEVRKQGLEGLELTTTQIARSFSTAEPRLSISPASLIRGRYYLLEIGGFAGLPDAKTGDLRRITYPFSGVSMQTGMFRLR